MIRCMGCMEEYAEGAAACPHCGYVRGTPPREAYHLAPESILEGKYIVGRVLGFGGFGVTYIGYDAQLERVVAIKEFLPTSFATRMPGGTAVTVYEGNGTTQFGFGLDRFVEEARRLAQFNGIPGITDIYDTFAGNNTAYIVMEYLKGRDVKDILAAEGPMDYERARDVVLRVCGTLAPVHQKGVIHRDISPDNIYLTASGEVKLLDFGAARYESSVNSKSLSVILKAGYAPEEQYRSRGDQGPWTDVYALAATFYKMLTGVTPPDSMERAVKDEIKEPSKLGATLPQSAENALMNALNIRKSERTQSVEDFKKALQSDGVERVKAKARRVSTGRIPVPALVGMGLAGVLLIVFLVLGATGVVNVGGGVLQDNFGDPVAEGNALVPALSGKTEAEAEKLLKDAGLTMEAGKPKFSDSVAPGMVMGQDPLPGRQVAEGSAVAVSLSVGAMESAMEAGLVPHLVGMGAVESVAFVQEQDNLYAEYKYDYSDTVPAGSVTRFERIPADDRITVYLSAGPDDGRAVYGTARAPVLYGSNLRLCIAAASAQLREQNEDAYTHWELQASTGGSWETVHTEDTGYYQDDEDAARGAPPFFNVYLRDLMAGQYAKYAGETLRLRAVQYARGDGEGGEAPLATVELGQSIHLEVKEQVVRLEGVEAVPWQDIGELVASGQLTSDHRLAQMLEEIPPEEQAYVLPVRLTGNFSENTNYRISVGDSRYFDYVMAEEQGVLYHFINYGGGGEGVVTLRVLKSCEVAYNEDATLATVTLDEPSTGTIAPMEAVLPLRGLMPDEALEKLLPISSKDNTIYNYFIPSQDVPAGQVVTWTGWKEEDTGLYQGVNLFVSVGPPGAEPVLVLGSTYRYDSDEGRYARQEVGGSMGGYQSLAMVREYSTDGGATWEENGTWEEIRGEEGYGGGEGRIFTETQTVPSDWADEPGVKVRLRLRAGDRGEELYRLEYDAPLASETAVTR